MVTRKYLSEKAIPKKYAEVKINVAASLQSAEIVALTCDGWTSRATDSYVTITCHYIGSDWTLALHVLQTQAVHTSHTASNIAALLNEALIEWNIGDKELALVTDNAANMVRAAALMNVLHFGCYAHTLNLASQAGLKLPKMAQLLGKIRRISGFFHRSSIASHTLKVKQKLLDLPSHKLKTDVVTRWNSALEMLEWFLEQHPAISAALLSPEGRRSEKDIFTLSEAAITTAEDIVKALNPMKVATLAMSEECTPTLSVIGPLHAQLLQEMNIGPGDSKIIKDLKSTIHDNLMSHIFKTDERDCQSGPKENTERKHRMKTVLLQQESDSTCVEDTVPVHQNATSLDPHDEVGDAEDPTAAKKTKMSALMGLLGAAYKTAAPASKKTVTEMAEEEVARHREAKPIILSENPLIWWKTHAEEYPLLAKQGNSYVSI
ncbi:E3 SUMO-protein ligase ZBED1-like [Triplophysa dalaica]|uniref:E3 SUMO-protein ligase ZBED1-like n=1 Tax=Triplophysa dalaica TaxID=1582913 RepID=UPI0024E00491|nr:E3 SUMO-protein ligase ZBED1-like [Triplophysa dalaica]